MFLDKSISEMKRFAADVRSGKSAPPSSDQLLQMTRLEMEVLPLQQRLLVGIPSAIFDLQNSLASLADQQLVLTETQLDLEQQVASLAPERGRQQTLLETKIASISHELDAAKADVQRAIQIAQQKQADLKSSLDVTLPTRVKVEPRLSRQPVGPRWWELGLLAGLGTAVTAVLALWIRQGLATKFPGKSWKIWLTAARKALGPDAPEPGARAKAKDSVAA